MASVKVKFRPSSIDGKEGIPSFFHRRQGGQHILSSDTQPRGPPHQDGLPDI